MNYVILVQGERGQTLERIKNDDPTRIRHMSDLDIVHHMPLAEAAEVIGKFRELFKCDPVRVSIDIAI